MSKVNPESNFDFIIENFKRAVTAFGIKDFYIIDKDLADIKSYMADCVMKEKKCLCRKIINYIFLTFKVNLDKSSKLNDSSKELVLIKDLSDILPLKIDWLKILRSYGSLKVDENMKVYLTRPYFVKSIFQLLDSMDDRIFANIVNTGFLLEFTHLYVLYFESVFHEEVWGVARAEQRFEQCVRIVRTQMPVAFTSLLIKRFTNRNMIEDAYEIANRTMKVIINDVEKDETMPYENKDYMLAKLRSLKLILGYPEELLFDKNIEDVYKDLELTGNETFLQLFIKTFTFSKIQEFSYFIKHDNKTFERNETTRWIDYTTEDEYVTPLYDLDNENTICKKKNLFFSLNLCHFF